MPSACLKPEKKAPLEAEDAMKQCIIVVDKKVRNLEKRKGKLESYREKSRQGDVLNSDQQEAISNYEAVLRNLEFARELQKQFCEIHERAEKLLKKRAKFEKQDRHNEEVARIQELLQVQSLLDNMGADEVREDFKTGNKGAVTLSEESLNQLDELYKLISPSRDGEESYMSQLTQAADHIVNFLDAKDKEVAGTTYKNLKDLIRQINECGYFDKSNTTEEEQTPAEQAGETEPEPKVTEDTGNESSGAEEASPVAAPEPVSPPLPPQASSATSSPQPPAAVSSEQPLPSQMHAAPELQTLPNPLQTSQTQNPAAAAAYQEDQVPVMARPRAFQEIVSSVQGSFDFLQDSEIEAQQKAKKSQEVLHVDPAVVAAHSLTGGSLHTTADPLSQSFGSATPTPSTFPDQQPPAQYQQSTKNQSVTESSLSQSQGFSEALAAPTQPQSSTQFGQSSTFDADMEAKWSQAGIYLPSSTTTESVERSWGEQASSAGTGVSSAPGQSWGDAAAPSRTPAWSTGGQGTAAATEQQSSSQQAGGANNTGVSDPPAPIPMPPSANTGGQSFSAQQDNETKSSLNPNADIFSSMYTNQSGSFSQDGGEFDSSNQMTNKQDRYGQSEMSGGYQSQGGYRGRRDYDNRGGPRGGRGGGPRGMSNGYGGRGNSRGGGGYRGDDRRGSGPRGGRGGPSFQGYPSRSGYQSEGYQPDNSSQSNNSNSSNYSFSSSSNSSSTHDHSGPGYSNKWGGPRGGAMRGGNSRGSSGPRGGNRGSYSRPTSAHNQ